MLWFPKTWNFYRLKSVTGKKQIAIRPPVELVQRTLGFHLDETISEKKLFEKHLRAPELTGIWKQQLDLRNVSFNGTLQFFFSLSLPFNDKIPNKSLCV